MDTATAALSEEAQRIFKKMSDRNKMISKWLNGLAAATAVAAVLGAWVSELSNVDLFGEKALVQSRVELDNRVIRSLGKLQMDVSTLRKAQAAIVQLPSGDKTGVQLSAVNSKLDTLAQRLDRLEQAIQDNPEKALTMPLMRRDIDNMRDSNAQSVENIKASVDQIYDLTKWLLGALAVGIFSLVASNYLQRKSD